MGKRNRKQSKSQLKRQIKNNERIIDNFIKDFHKYQESIGIIMKMCIVNSYYIHKELKNRGIDVKIEYGLGLVDYGDGSNILPIGHTWIKYNKKIYEPNYGIIKHCKSVRYIVKGKINNNIDTLNICNQLKDLVKIDIIEHCVVMDDLIKDKSPNFSHNHDFYLRIVNDRVNDKNTIRLLKTFFPIHSGIPNFL